MPDQSAHLAALAANKHVLFGSFFLFDRGAPVAVYDVDTTPVFPTYDLDVTLDTGSASDVRHGMLYIIETAGGLEKGMGFLRSVGSISSGNLPVRELSRGTIDVAAGDVVKVYRYWLPGDKLVGATIAFNPDGLSYTDQGSDPPPIGNNGGAYAGFSSQLPFPLTDSLGYVVDPDSSSAVTVSRTLPTGLSYASGDDTTLDVEVTGDEGTYWIETVVTDPDNGKSTTRYTPVCIDDSPLDCTVEPYGGDVDNGWRLTVTFRQEVIIPRGTIGAFVAKEYIDGVQGSYGSASPGRSHIKFLGIVRRLTCEGSGADGVHTVSYEFVSPLAWLLETPGFSKVMLDAASPASWMDMKTLGTKRAKLQIIQFYSTLNESGYDVIFRDNYRDKRYPGFFPDKNTPIAQLRELADGVGARLMCTRQGRFEFFTRPRFLPLNERDSVPTMLTPTLDMILRYTIHQELKDPVEKITFSGFVAGAANNAPFRIAYPGKAPGTGVESPQFEKMICDSIQDAEEEAGRRGALVQQKFVTEDDEALSAYNAEIVLYGSLDVLDLYGEWVGLPALPNRAGIDTTQARHELDSLNVEYVNGTARITARLFSETNGAPGQYDPPPAEPPFGDFTDYPWDWGGGFEIVDEPIFLSGDTDRIALIFKNGRVARTANFKQTGASLPNYNTVYDLSGTVGTDVLAWAFDARSNASTGACGWIATADEIYYLSGIGLGTPAATLQHTFASSSSLRCIDASFGAGGEGLFVMVVSYYKSAGGTKSIATRNGGISWGSEVTVTSHSQGSGNWSNGLRISSRFAGLAYTSAFTQTDATDGEANIFRTLNYGQSWAVYPSNGQPDEGLAGDIEIPWHNNPAGSLLWHGRTNLSGAPTGRLLVKSDTGVVLVNTLSRGPLQDQNGRQLSSSPSNSARLMAVVREAAGVNAAVVATADLGTHWAQVLASGTDARRVALVDDFAAYIYGASDFISFTPDFGANVYDKSGDLSVSSEIVGVTGY